MTMPKATVTFTVEEKKILTALDAAAHDLMRVESRIKGEIPPCWLVCSDEVRAVYREKVIDLAVTRGGSSGRLPWIRWRCSRGRSRRVL